MHWQAVNTRQVNGSCGECFRVSRSIELLNNKSPPLRTMDWDLMFSQRNNPYCDLLKISDHNYFLFVYD